MSTGAISQDYSSLVRSDVLHYYHNISSKNLAVSVHPSDAFRQGLTLTCTHMLRCPRLSASIEFDLRLNISDSAALVIADHREISKTT